MIASTVDPSNEENWSVVAGGVVDVIVTAKVEREGKRRKILRKQRSCTIIFKKRNRM